MDESIRAFIAIELPKQVKDELSSIQKNLRNSGADVKWVEPENIHFTLKFLGNTEKTKIKDITDALNEIAKKIKSFSMNLTEIGAFPRISYPRVIWVGIKEGANTVSELAKTVEGKLNKLGFPKEDRPFSAHITIGRVRSPKGKEKLKTQVENLNKSKSQLADYKIQISKITLFQSTLMPTGPTYTKLHEAHLETT